MKTPGCEESDRRNLESTKRGDSRLASKGLHPHGPDLVDGEDDRPAAEALLGKVTCDPLSTARSIGESGVNKAEIMVEKAEVE